MDHIHTHHIMVQILSEKLQLVQMQSVTYSHIQVPNRTPHTNIKRISNKAISRERREKTIQRRPLFEFHLKFVSHSTYLSENIYLSHILLPLSFGRPHQLRQHLPTSLQRFANYFVGVLAR